MTELTGSAPEQRVAMRLVWRVVALGVMAVCLLVLLHFPAGNDQAVFMAVADAMAEGGRPYRDLWDVKPPGVHAIYALARGLFGEGITAVRLFEAIWWAATAFVIWLIGRRFLGGDQALIAPVLVLIGNTSSGFWNTGQPEGFSLLPIGCAIWLTLRSGGSRRGLLWVLAAAASAAAALMKPTLGAAGAICFVWSAALLLRGRDWRGGLLLAAAYLAGALAVIGPALAYLAAGGALEPARDIAVEFLPRYVEAARAGTSTPEAILRGIETLIAKWPVALLAVPATLAGLREDRARAALSLVGLITLALFAGAVMQGRFYLYHLAAAGGLGTVLGGWGIALLWRRLPAGRLALRAAVVLGVAALLALPNPAFLHRWSMILQIALAAETREDLMRVFYEGRGNFSYRDQTDAAAWLKANAPDPGATVYTWGLAQSVTVGSGLRTATRYLFNTPLRTPGYGAPIRAEVIAALRAAPPWAIVVHKTDAEPPLSRDPGSSAEVLESRFPELAEMIRQGYARGADFPSLTIHVRRH